MNASRLVWPAIAILAIGVLVLERVRTLPVGSRAASHANQKEFYAWEKTALGTYKQVKKTYSMNEETCGNVVRVLNGMSTQAPRSNWVLSHTTASTFECLPANAVPSGSSGSISEYSDDGSDHTDGRASRSKASVVVGATRATLDKQAMCSAQATKAFADMGYPKDAIAGYQNHYNARLNKCFIEVSNTDPKVSPGTIWTYRFVFDAFEGKQYGTYSWHTEKDKKYWEVKPFECEVVLPSGEKQFCNSDDEFTQLIRVYMEDRD